MKDGELTAFAEMAQNFMIIDENAGGAIVNLGLLYLIYMGMLAVFCTNAINIYAGINGLEVGQSYVMGCAVLLHNFIEIRMGTYAENHLFSAMIMLSFISVSLGLLKHNWYPASVFRWRYVLLLCRNDICSSWYPWSLQQDTAVILHTANHQLHLVNATAIPNRSLSETQTSEVQL